MLAPAQVESGRVKWSGNSWRSSNRTRKADLTVSLKTLRFPPNPQKSLSKCKFPHDLRAPIDQAAGWDRQPGAPRHVRTYMFSESFPTKTLGINGDLQSHIVSPNNDSQVRFELDGKGYGGSGRKESTKSLVKQRRKLIKSDLI